jgi:alpha-beta hydrolase superfamily lysophospholipase
MRLPIRRLRVWSAALLTPLAALALLGCGGQDVGIHAKSDSKPLVKWGAPSGSPKGVVILLHGGGWQPSLAAYQGEMPTAATLQRLGYATVVIGYDEGATGFREIKQVYSKVRQRYPDLPVCVHGFSAGGNLGLMLAAREPGIDCVLALAAPTDLPALKDQGAGETYDLAVNAFGEDQLANWSPVHDADRINAKVLLINAQSDPVVPVEQAREFVKARPDTELVVIPSGSAPLDWLHGAEVNPGQAQAAVQQGFTFITQALNGS